MKKRINPIPVGFFLCRKGGRPPKDASGPLAPLRTGVKQASIGWLRAQKKLRGVSIGTIIDELIQSAMEDRT